MFNRSFTLSPTLILLSLSFYLSTSFATPVVEKRFDLDGNGTPDLCFSGPDGTANCLLSNGSWTTIETSTYLPASSKTAVSTKFKTRSASGATSAITASISHIHNTTLPTSTSATPQATVTLPDPSEFTSLNGTKWSIKYVGNLQFTDTLQAKGLGGDKCRSGKLGDKVIWSCGDMECGGDFTACGFSMVHLKLSSVQLNSQTDFFLLSGSSILRDRLRYGREYNRHYRCSRQQFRSGLVRRRAARLPANSLWHGHFQCRCDQFYTRRRVRLGDLAGSLGW